MQIYTIIAGVNGAGKSSFTGSLQRSTEELGIIIDADMLAKALGGSPVAGGRVAIQQIRNCLKKRLSFTQETTLSGSLTARTAQQARELGYFVRMRYIGLDEEEESLARIANRVRRGGHDIPQEDVHRRFENRAKSLSAVLPFCHEAIFFDNGNGFVAVGEYQNGRIVCFENAPRWMKEMRQQLMYQLPIL